MRNSKGMSSRTKKKNKTWVALLKKEENVSRKLKKTWVTQKSWVALKKHKSSQATNDNMRNSKGVSSLTQKTIILMNNYSCASCAKEMTLMSSCSYRGTRAWAAAHECRINLFMHEQNLRGGNTRLRGGNTRLRGGNTRSWDPKPWIAQKWLMSSL